MDIFEALYQNNITLIKRYLEKEDINIRNEKGQSLLISAILYNNYEIFDLLLDNFINVNIKDNFGLTAAHYAVINNHLGFLKTLIRSKADLDIVDNDGENVLYKACLYGRENMISLILEKKSFYILDTNNKGESLFDAIVRSRNMNLLEHIRLSSDILNSRDIFKKTPLHKAALSGDVAVLYFLLSNKAFINAKDENLLTPIYYAIMEENYSAVDMLLKYGALVDLTDMNNKDIFSYCKSLEMKEYLKTKISEYKPYEYKKIYPLHHAIIDKNNDLIKLYLKEKGTIRKDCHEYSPYDLAILTYNEKLIKYFTKKKNL